MVKLIPGYHDSSLLGLVTQPHPPRALVLELYGTGNAPNTKMALIELLRGAAEKDIVVAACSQCKKGAVDFDAYAVGKAFADAGVLPCLDMTVSPPTHRRRPRPPAGSRLVQTYARNGQVEACVTKLSHLLAAYEGNAAMVRSLLATPLRGEISAREMYTVQQAAVCN